MALILSRRPNEAIHIGDDVIVKVIEVSGRVVKIAITAPDDVHILRSELVGIPDPKAEVLLDQ